MSRDYLIIEDFLQDALQARALQAAFELGIVDRLANNSPCAATAVFETADVDQLGSSFLQQMLVAGGVIEVDSEEICLTEHFCRALPFRDVLEAKLKFAELVASDYFDRLPQLLKSTEDFMASSRLFEVFDYGRCIDVTTENCMKASRWMQLTTMLTRYEAPVCCEFYNFGRHQHMLDIGGNSGEFALQVCQRSPGLTASVMDLPVVCQVGQRHVASAGEQQRISFHPGNMLEDEFPQYVDLISWKSVLHDWPDQHAKHLLKRTWDTLPAGGSVLIFEREAWDVSVQPTGYGLLPVLLFFRSYRQPSAYDSWLQEVGFRNIRCQQVQLEVPFLLITAEK